MKHKYKITDATKQELIDYFFGVEGLGGGYRIPADKDRFFIWLAQKRADALIDASKTASKASQKALKEYISFVQQANDTEDLGEKLALLEKANNAYKRYEEYNRQYDLIEKKLDKALEL
ncbi:MAG: hypothetical protein E7279_11635 [Lachnospiraceae bacterium]|nr:hypothetical protein [Lachnospiraceae bacterium]